MGASVTYKYRKTSDGLWMVLLGIPLLIAYGAGLILIIIGAVRMRGSGKVKQIRAKGISEYGKVAYKIKEHNENIVSLKKNKVTFYYKTKDGLLGRTIQSINKKTSEAISKLGNIIPIKRVGNQAVIDESRLDQVVENVELDFSSQEPAYKYKYGEMKKSSIVFISLAALFYIARDLLGLLGLLNNQIYVMIITTLVVVLNVFLLVLSILFFIIGVSNLSYYGLAKKIRGEGDIKKTGTLIPILNKETGTSTLVLPKKAIFQYTSEDGLLIETHQRINKKMFNKIMEKGKDEVEIIELNRYAVIDNKAVLEKEDGNFDKLFGYIKLFRIFFFFALISNIYFLVSEIIHFIQSSFSDGISLFTIVVYSLTLIYMIVMELLDLLKKDGFWAYLSTLLFLSFNVVGTIGTLAYNFINEGIYFVHKSNMVMFGFGSIYFIYIMYKITKSVVNGKTAKWLDLDYERCQDMGDTISNAYVLINFVAWTISSYFVGKFDSYNFGFETFLFFGVVIFNFIISIVYIVACVHGLGKRKRLHRDTIED